MIANIVNKYLEKFHIRGFKNEQWNCVLVASISQGV